MARSAFTASSKLACRVSDDFNLDAISSESARLAEAANAVEAVRQNKKGINDFMAIEWTR